MKLQNVLSGYMKIRMTWCRLNLRPLWPSSYHIRAPECEPAAPNSNLSQADVSFGTVHVVLHKDKGYILEGSFKCETVINYSTQINCSDIKLYSYALSHLNFW